MKKPGKGGLKKGDHRTGHGYAGGASSAALPQQYSCWQVGSVNGLSGFKSQTSSSATRALQVIYRATNGVVGSTTSGQPTPVDTGFLENGMERRILLNVVKRDPERCLIDAAADSTVAFQG